MRQTSRKPGYPEKPSALTEPIDDWGAESGSAPTIGPVEIWGTEGPSESGYRLVRIPTLSKLLHGTALERQVEEHRADGSTKRQHFRVGTSVVLLLLVLLILAAKALGWL